VEPNFSVNGSRYRVLAPSNELFPAMSNTCCLTTAAKARSSGDFLRGVLAARRKAVDYLYDDPAGAAGPVANAYRIDRPLAERVIRNMIVGSVGDVTYWSRGRVRVPTIDRMMQGARLVGIIDGSYDVREIVDQSFLPADQREAG
jgi:NitT/TauT family transport system substrate-binding protein